MSQRGRRRSISADRRRRNVGATRQIPADRRRRRPWFGAPKLGSTSHARRFRSLYRGFPVRLAAKDVIQAGATRFSQGVGERRTAEVGIIDERLLDGPSRQRGNQAKHTFGLPLAVLGTVKHKRRRRIPGKLFENQSGNLGENRGSAADSLSLDEPDEGGGEGF